MSGGTGPSPDLDALFDAWERAWSGRDEGAFAPLCAEGFHYEDPLTPEPIEGVAALLGHVRQLWRAFPDARVQPPGDRLTNGIHAAAPAKLLATHRAPLGNLAATNRFIVVHGVFYAQLEDERLLRVRAFFDAFDAGRQLGVLPRSGTAGERALFMLRGFGLR